MIKEGKNRRYFIKTYGCQMNIVDSEKLAAIFEAAGYQPAKSRKEADFLLVNTCVVRQGAEDRAVGYAFTAKGLREHKPNLKIGLCGCIVTEPGRDIKKQFPHIDVFVPPHSPEVLADFLKLENPSPSGRGGVCSSVGRGEGITKYITIMHGCDNYCSYCVVPYVRGREHSRPIADVLEDVRQSGSPAVKEIFLLGQNVNSYKYGLAKLLKEIEILITHYSLPITRIRFMTNHPKDMSDEIIQAVADLPRVCEFFHLPIQHGSDRILKLMNRGYTVDYYRKLVEKIRAKVPGAAITGDIIVGFPGETDEDFRLTLRIVEQIGFDACNTLMYSQRPGTAASKLEDDVPQKVKKERLHQLMKLVDSVCIKNNKKLVGTVQEVLVDNSSLSHPLSLSEREGAGGVSSYTGRTRTNKIVKFPSERKDLLGHTVSVKITSALSWLLKGELVNEEH